MVELQFERGFVNEVEGGQVGRGRWHDHGLWWTSRGDDPSGIRKHIGSWPLVLLCHYITWRGEILDGGHAFGATVDLAAIVESFEPPAHSLLGLILRSAVPWKSRRVSHMGMIPIIWKSTYARVVEWCWQVLFRLQLSRGLFPHSQGEIRSSEHVTWWHEVTLPWIELLVTLMASITSHELIDMSHRCCILPPPSGRSL